MFFTLESDTIGDEDKAALDSFEIRFREKLFVGSRGSTSDKSE
jgi:hypothetical protein